MKEDEGGQGEGSKGTQGLPWGVWGNHEEITACRRKNKEVQMSRVKERDRLTELGQLFKGGRSSHHAMMNGFRTLKNW